MKGWCVIPERMNAHAFVQALSPYTNFICHTKNECMLGISPGILRRSVLEVSPLRCVKSLLAPKTCGVGWDKRFPTPEPLPQDV